NVIETVASIVGWQFVFHFEIEAGQIADGIAILGAVQPPNRDFARVGILGVNLEDVGFDPIGQFLCSRASGRGFFSGGMMPARTFLSALKNKSRCARSSAWELIWSNATLPFSMPSP